ncbi:hypothetical protein CHLRE_06g258300v5 [Chlamydomonas reinhardtii]|uniref:Glycosyltransferase family 92 protein n=1 Tax=Chlamydomonas reinhardtii TaxID=3055 RepID=A0A2K3DMJ7_CHLRE|nr:uncharacterized protein CHLRE_06g258300v5 [Chlamydomonas reinhardtii]PNW81740.1 hypothetical protein CHLRE_06g258300v5 [Chlamydomonas reinhardtii]
MPHQKKTYLRAFIWVDYTGDLNLRAYGHLRLPVDQYAWQPRLVLEPPDPALAPINATVEPPVEALRFMGGHFLRPFAMRFELPADLEGATCFKLFETSYPGHKAPFCVPLEGMAATLDAAARGGESADDGDAAAITTVCDQLAPPDQYTDKKPALWAAIGPPRHAKSTREWNRYYSQIAIRTVHYLAYHVAMGMSGLLLYTDAVQRHYLRKQLVLQPYLRAGHLRLVDWDLPERNHADDGRGRPLGYNYDQALFATHALLGLSACGSNIALLISDYDEYLFSFQAGTRWPAPYGDCMPTTASRPAPNTPVAIHTLQRVELLSSRVPPALEPRVWAVVPVSVRRAFAADTGDPTAGLHPLAVYNRRGPKPMTHNRHNKPIVFPSAEVVSFFVHEGAPLHGTSALVDKECLILLHVSNYWIARSDTGIYRRLNVTDFVEFQHWMFDTAARGAAAGITYLT